MGANHPSITRDNTREGLIRSLLNLYKYIPTTTETGYTTLGELRKDLESLEYHQLLDMVYTREDEVEKADRIHDERMRDLI